MGVDISNEAVSFLCTVISGAVLGLLFDFFSQFSRALKRKTLITFFDIFFVIATAIIIMSVFYIANSYKLRWYMFIGLFLGLILYCLMLRRVSIFIFSSLFGIFLKIFHFILKILLTPARFLYKILLVYLFVPLRKTVSFPFVFLIQKIKFLLNRGKKNERRKNRYFKKKEKV